jgi:prepilin signal peptidase PulO-like enzyme (type II secretory pathway)
VQYYLTTISILFGLVIGSFLNVVIYRVPRRESLVRPGSHCPGCGVGISWFDNIPVVSWLLLRARCRSCRTRISSRYPLVEGITGLAYAAAFWRIGPSPALLLAWAFVAVLIVLVYVNHDHLVVPNRLVVPAVIVGLGAAMALDPQHWWHYLAACSGAGLFVLLLSLARPGTTRFGETKIAFLMGAVLGPYVLVALPVALILGIVGEISLVFREKYRLIARTAFAPYLAVGAAMAVFFGQLVFHLYTGS